MTINHNQVHLANELSRKVDMHPIFGRASLVCRTVVMVPVAVWCAIFCRRHIVEQSCPRRCQGLATRREVVRVTLFVQFRDDSCATREVLVRKTALELSREIPHNKQPSSTAIL